MHAFEVLNRCRAPQVEEIFAHTSITSMVTLAGGDMCKGVFDRSAFTQ
jgi:hypothetical protein